MELFKYLSETVYKSVYYVLNLIIHFQNTLKVYILSYPKDSWGCLIMEIIKTIRDGSNEIQNHISVKEGNYIHKQIEKRNNLVFMRIKTRKLFNIETI